MVPSLFRRGVPAVAVSRDPFEGTGFTRVIYDGATFVGYFTGGDLAHSLVDVLSRPVPPPLIFAYWDDLDLAQHLRGPRPRLIDLELERVDALLASVVRRIAPSLARQTTVWITGDHGQVPMERIGSSSWTGSPPYSPILPGRRPATAAQRTSRPGRAILPPCARSSSRAFRREAI